MAVEAAITIEYHANLIGYFVTDMQPHNRPIMFFYTKCDSLITNVMEMMHNLGTYLFYFIFSL